MLIICPLHEVPMRYTLINQFPATTEYTCSTPADIDCCYICFDANKNLDTAMIYHDIYGLWYIDGNISLYRIGSKNPGYDHLISITNPELFFFNIDDNGNIIGLQQLIDRLLKLIAFI